MTRVYQVKKSRKVQRCHVGHDIPAGSTYTYTTPGFRGRTIYACEAHPFRPSNLTGNDLLSQYYEVVECLEDDLMAWDGHTIETLVDAVQSASSSVGDVISEWENQLDNMGTLAVGDAGQVIQERLEAAQDWQTALDDAGEQLTFLAERDDGLEDIPDMAETIVEDVIGQSNL